MPGAQIQHCSLNGNAGVSAILLSPGIDTGDVLWQETYPLPPAGMNIDYSYDGIIRADTLTRVLTHYQTHGRLPHRYQQNEAEGDTYYVVHPVIKTLSILGVS